MAGTVKASIIQHDVSNVATVFKDGAGTEIGQLTKTWCNYNAVGTSVRASFNTSSVTKNATANYTFNFTNSFSDANYSLSGSAQQNNSYYTHLHFGPYGPGSLTVSSVTCITPYNSGSGSGDIQYVDAIYCLMSINR